MTYSNSTASGNLRNHLRDHHGDVWISACDKLGIEITAKSCKGAVDDFHARQGHKRNPDTASAENIRQKYTHEAFVDAIVEFIVSNDQVCRLFCPMVSNINIFI